LFNRPFPGSGGRSPDVFDAKEKGNIRYPIKAVLGEIQDMLQSLTINQLHRFESNHIQTIQALYQSAKLSKPFCYDLKSDNLKVIKFLTLFNIFYPDIFVFDTGELDVNISAMFWIASFR
jgi:hypothetical protein